MPDFEPMPPMDANMGGGMQMGDGGFGDGMPNQPVMDDGMGMDMPPVGNEPNQFDTNFDAGVEADENSDPKKFIQQLTGKLSQSLRNYNQSLPQPDADLDKYVAGMIVKQATDGLSQEDRKEILDKVNNDDVDEQPAEEPQQDGGDMTPMPQDNMGGMPPMGNGQPMESFNRRGKRRVNELTIQPGQQDDDTPKVKKAATGSGYRRKPFSAPQF